MIVIFTGLPGAGKSVKMADTMINVLYRNKAWFEKQQRKYQKVALQSENDPFKMPLEAPKKRQVISNLKLSQEVEEEFFGYIQYWSEPHELPLVRDADVFWDEIATHLDSTQWQNMSLELKRWLQQHRKYGIEIYGTTQDFAMIDKSMRRLCSDLYIITKLFGSRDKSTTKPDPKFIWGISLVQYMDPTIYDESISKQMAGFPSFMWIGKDRVKIFDTTQEIKQGKYPPLNHIERECISPNCTFHKVVHA